MSREGNGANSPDYGEEKVSKKRNAVSAKQTAAMEGARAVQLADILVALFDICDKSVTEGHPQYTMVSYMKKQALRLGVKFNQAP